jgi:hypothetical protein
MLRSLMKEQHRAQSSTYHREVYMNMLTHIPALASALRRVPPGVTGAVTKRLALAVGPGTLG